MKLLFKATVVLLLVCSLVPASYALPTVGKTYTYSCLSAVPSGNGVSQSSTLPTFYSVTTTGTIEQSCGVSVKLISVLVTISVPNMNLGYVTLLATPIFLPNGIPVSAQAYGVSVSPSAIPASTQTVHVDADFMYCIPSWFGCLGVPYCPSPANIRSVQIGQTECGYGKDISVQQFTSIYNEFLAT